MTSYFARILIWMLFFETLHSNRATSFQAKFIFHCFQICNSRGEWTWYGSKTGALAGLNNCQIEISEQTHFSVFHNGSTSPFDTFLHRPQDVWDTGALCQWKAVYIFKWTIIMRRNGVTVGPWSLCQHQKLKENFWEPWNMSARIRFSPVKNMYA